MSHIFGDVNAVSERRDASGKFFFPSDIRIFTRVFVFVEALGRKLVDEWAGVDGVRFF